MTKPKKSEFTPSELAEIEQSEFPLYLVATLFNEGYSIGEVAAVLKMSSGAFTTAFTERMASAARQIPRADLIEVAEQARENLLKDVGLVLASFTDRPGKE